MKKALMVAGDKMKKALMVAGDKMKKALMIVAIIVLVAIAGSVIYYFVFFRPDIQRQDLEFQKSKYETEQKQKQDEQSKIEQANKALAEENKKINLLNDLAALDKWHTESLTKAFNTYSDSVKRLDESYQSQKEDIYRLYLK